jgi:hypothetical protein
LSGIDYKPGRRIFSASLGARRFTHANGIKALANNTGARKLTVGSCPIFASLASAIGPLNCTPALLNNNGRLRIKAHQTRTISCTGDICRAALRTGQGCTGGCQSRLRAANQNHLVTGPMKLPGDGQTNASGAASDKYSVLGCLHGFSAFYFR